MIISNDTEFSLRPVDSWDRGFPWFYGWLFRGVFGWVEIFHGNVKREVHGKSVSTSIVIIRLGDCCNKSPDHYRLYTLSTLVH